MASSGVYNGSSFGLPVSFSVSKSAKSAHNKVDGTLQSLAKELAVVNRQCYYSLVDKNCTCTIILS